MWKEIKNTKNASHIHVEKTDLLTCAKDATFGWLANGRWTQTPFDALDVDASLSSVGQKFGSGSRALLLLEAATDDGVPPLGTLCTRCSWNVTEMGMSDENVHKRQRYAAGGFWWCLRCDCIEVDRMTVNGQNGQRKVFYNK